jgi:hypothetical protein
MAGLDQEAEMLRKEIARLRSLVSGAAYDLKGAGQERKASRLLRALEGRWLAATLAARRGVAATLAARGGGLAVTSSASNLPCRDGHAAVGSVGRACSFAGRGWRPLGVLLDGDVEETRAPGLDHRSRSAD